MQEILRPFPGVDVEELPMKFGVCTDARGAAQAASQGWDYVEGNVQGIFHGELPEDMYAQSGGAGVMALPMPVANCLLPGAMKIVGDTVDDQLIGQYMDRVIRRAAAAGTTILVFGSGVARCVPEGWSRDAARQQILSFLRMAGPIAQQAGVTIVIEPLNTAECNILNTVNESMDYVRSVGHPSIQCLVDSYHFWMVDEPLENLRLAMDSIRHVHVADKVGRTPPGESGQSDYIPFFSVLKSAGYSGCISVEAHGFDLAAAGSRVLSALRLDWDRA